MQNNDYRWITIRWDSEKENKNKIVRAIQGKDQLLSEKEEERKSLQTDISVRDLVKYYHYFNNELLPNLFFYKEKKINDLKNDFNKSKAITIINGNNLTIKYNCPKRDYFLNILEEVKRLDDNTEISHIFTQKSSGLGFKVSPFIVNYILLKDFTEKKNGRIIKIREHNTAIVYDNAESKIEKANSIQELESISWNFLKPNGIEININDRVVDIMSGEDPNLKEAVAKVIDKDGDLHFIKTLDELEL